MLPVIALFVAMAHVNASEPPSDAEVLRALRPVVRGVPYVFSEFRDDVVIVKNRLKQRTVGPQLYYPLIGPARLVETHWECTAYDTQTLLIAFPFPITVKKPRVQIVYIDKHALRADGKK